MPPSEDQGVGAVSFSQSNFKHNHLSPYLEKAMTINHTLRTRTEPQSATRNRAAFRDALLWGIVYTTAATGAAYAAPSNIHAEPLALSNAATDSMAMLLPFGAARGLVMRHMKRIRKNRGLDRRTLRWLNKRLPRRSRPKST